MKICFYGDFENLHTRRWVNFFIKLGHEVHLLADEHLDYPGATVHLCKIRSKMPYRLVERFRNLRKLINKEIKPDIFHAHFVTHYGYGGALSGFHPFVLTVWGSDLYLVPKRSRLDYFMSRFTIKRADLITVDSRDLGNKVLELGAAPSKIHLIQFGVESQKYKYVDVSHLRNKLKIPANGFVVLSMRKLKPLYNHDIVIQAAKYVISEIPNCYFLIVGKGEHKNELEKLVEKMHLEKHVLILEECPHEKVPEFLSLADVFVSIPSSDGTSVTLLEAMASALPVIVSNLASNREWVAEGENGFVIPLRSPEKLANSIIELYRDKNKMSVFGQRSAKIVAKRADHKTNMMKMEELYSSLKKR